MTDPSHQTGSTPNAESAAARPQAAGSETVGPSVEDLVRIMDVASALRREREIAEAQLTIDVEKERIRKRLQETAAITGEAVTAAEIDAAIDVYYGSLHRFEEPARGVKWFLAHAYVRRGAAAAAVGVILVAAAFFWWGFLSPWAPFSGTGRSAILAEQIDAAGARVEAVADDPGVAPQLVRLREEARVLSEQSDADGLGRILAQVESIEERLNAEYSLRIVSRPGEKSGVDSYFVDESGKRLSGYFLIVEEIGTGGERRRRAVTSVETRKSRQVSKWGERVPRSVYEAVKQDKQSDGVLDRDIFARKLRGRLDEDIVLPGVDPAQRAQITEW